MSLLTHSLVITSLSLLCTVVGVAGSVTAATRWRLPRGGGEANRRRVGQRVDESADDGHAEDVRGLSASPGFLCGGKKPERPCDMFLLVHSVLPALSISEIWVLTQLMTEGWKMQPSLCSSGSADWALSTGTLFVLLRWLIEKWERWCWTWFRFRFHFYCTEQEIHLTGIILFFCTSVSGFLFPSTKLTNDRNRIKTECLLYCDRVKYKH